MKLQEAINEVISRIPSSEDLQKIERWDKSDGWNELMSHIKLLWGDGFIEKDVLKYKIYKLREDKHNDMIIEAMQSNRWFWQECWYMSKKNGIYEFRVAKTR